MFSCAPYLLIVVCLAFFRAGSENLPTCVFQVRFPPRKHGVRGNECQKRSVVSVWYAQNSLPLCTEVWYTTLTGCEDPTKMLIRVCILLQMQPVPLTGTATTQYGQNAAADEDAARTPHGDSNSFMRTRSLWDSSDAARAPHGDSNVFQLQLVYPGLHRDAARTPHGDSNVAVPCRRLLIFRDAARTPHGASNAASMCCLMASCKRCSPHPSRGQKRRRHTRFCVTPSFLLSRGGLKPL